MEARAVVDPEGLLAHVRAAPAQARSRLLGVWFCSESASPPPVRMWASMLDAVPAPGRIEVLVMMAGAIPDNAEYGCAVQTLVAAEHACLDADGMLPADHARLLTRLADWLGANTADANPIQLGQFWDEVFALAQRLPLSAQSCVMSALAALIHKDDGPSTVDHAAGPGPRWSGFIDYVCSHFGPADVDRILGELARCGSQSEEGDPDPAPLSRALMMAAGSLPEEWHAKLVATILQNGPAGDEAAQELWDAGFRAGKAIGARHAAPLYESLARAIPLLPVSLQQSRWDALCQRLAEYEDTSLLTPALLELAQAPVGKRSPERRTKLLRMGERLPAKERGMLGAAMTVTGDITPALWRAQVMELQSLPPHVRYRAAGQLCAALFRYETDAGVFQPASAEPVMPDPGGLASAEYPNNAMQALSRLSDLLALLPLADRGAVLLSLSQMGAGLCHNPSPWRSARVNWLLGEVGKLAPLHHHGVEVVTNVAMSAASQCPSEAEALAVLPALYSSAAAIPAEGRVSALVYITAMVQRLVKDQRWQQGAKALWTGLPAGDLTPFRPHKRKEPPADAAG